MRFLPLLLLACVSSDEPCVGEGPGRLDLGLGAHDAFTVYGDGDRAPLVQSGGEWGFELSVRTEGLDVTEAVDFVLTVSVAEEPPRVLLGSGDASCLPDGGGWLRIWAPLAGADQSLDDAAATDGAPLVVTIQVEDHAGDVAEEELRLVVDASGV